MISRLEYIDRLKGFAILLVIMGHFIEKNVIEGNFHPLYSFIYFFHMPLFMFISGYVAIKCLKIELVKFDEIINFIKNKARALILPYFTWGILMPIFFFSYDFHFDLLPRLEELIVQYAGLWFLPTLFLLSLLFLIYRIIGKKVLNFKGGKLLVIFTLFIVVVGLYYIYPIQVLRSVISYFPFYFLGVIVVDYKTVEKIYCNKIAFSLFAIAFLVITVHFNYSEAGLNSKFIKIISSLAAIPTFYYLSRFMKWNAIIDNQIQLWGRNSLVIYVTQFQLLIFFTSKLTLHIPTYTLVLISLIISLIIGYTCILIGNIIKYSPIMDLLLYGRKSKNSIL